METLLFQWLGSPLSLDPSPRRGEGTLVGFIFTGQFKMEEAASHEPWILFEDEEEWQADTRTLKPDPPSTFVNPCSVFDIQGRSPFP